MAMSANKVKTALFAHYGQRNIPIEKVEELRELFRLLDREGKGVVNV